MNWTSVRSPQPPAAPPTALVDERPAGELADERAGTEYKARVEGEALVEVLSGLGRARDLVDLASRAPFSGADAEELASVIDVGSRLRSAVEALLLASAAAMEAAQAGSGRAALRDTGRLSARKAARIAAVGEQVAQMPRVANDLARGKLTVEHAEVLADAARRSSPHAVNDADNLLKTAASASPEVLRRDARAFVAEHDPKAAEGEHRRQRRDRGAALFVDEETGMGVLNARFDPVSFAAVSQAVENYSDALWRLDGGRDGTPAAVRDNRQRLADSVFEMLTGRNALEMHQAAQLPTASIAGGAGGADAGDGAAGGDEDDGAGGSDAGEGACSGAADGHGESADPPFSARQQQGATFDRDVGGDAGPADHDYGRSITQWAPSGAPNQLVVVADIGIVDGTKPDGRCDVLGVGPVPKSILDDLSPDTRVSGALFAGPGNPLWLGRSRRLASVAQQLAVAIRDRGCVLCGTPMHRCDYHHIDEWEADQGPTDVPNLAALCRTCHSALHKQNRRLARDPSSGHWTTRKRLKQRGRTEQSGRMEQQGRTEQHSRTASAIGTDSGRDPPD